MKQAAGSFRDPCGQVFVENGEIIRTINDCYQEHWQAAEKSGLLQDLVESGFVPPYQETEQFGSAWKTIKVQKIPFISYPYEWSFSQLRDAALLTLRIQKRALRAGLTLKDASAFNIQFLNGKPIFIDLLSFEKRVENSPWQGYRQFCKHFLAPLALYAKDNRLGRLSTLWIDGIGLDLAWSLLGAKTRLSFGLQMHLHLHASAENKHNDGRASAKKVKKAEVSTQGLLDLTDSLYRTVKSIRKSGPMGEWADYYTDTNYSAVAEQEKTAFVEQCARLCAGNLAVDLGANTGKFSRIMQPFFKTVLSVDLDPDAVDYHYRHLPDNPDANVLPLVLDLANPTPALGWACAERLSWLQRSQADFASALALTHHLYFSAGIPWSEQADFFAAQVKPGGCLLVEFVPRGDSQVERLLAARDDIFPDYNRAAFVQNFSQSFVLEQERQIKDSQRLLLLLRRK